MDTIRIYLTENCNASCKHCFNASLRSNAHMDLNKCMAMYDWLRDNGVQSIKIMGGEPTVHPNFIQLFQLAQDHFESVQLFTNGIDTEKLKQISLRDVDKIVYNFAFTNPDTYLFEDSPFVTRVFEIVIHPNEDVDALIDKVKRISKLCRYKKIVDYRFNLTLDCTANIFDDNIKSKYNFVMYQILEEAYNSGFPFRLGYDHEMPLCIWNDETLKLMNIMDFRYPSLCNGLSKGCFGLIDAKFNLKHCNQYQENICNIFDENDCFIPFHMMENLLIKQSMKKHMIIADSKCIDCKHFMKACNGGCVAHKFTNR